MKSMRPKCCGGGFVGERDRDVARGSLGHARSRHEVAQIGQERALVDVEIELDRVERHDRREERVVCVDEVPDRNEPPRDTSRDGRADLREFHVELGSAQGRIGSVEGGPGAERHLAALVGDLLRDVAGLAQLVCALEIALGEIERGLGRRDAGHGVIQRIPIGALVDREEEVALLDDGAVDEMNLVEITRHPRPQIDRIDSVEPADEIVALGDLLDDGLADRHRRWRRLSAGRRRHRCKPPRKTEGQTHTCNAAAETDQGCPMNALHAAPQDQMYRSVIKPWVGRRRCHVNVHRPDRAYDETMSSNRGDPSHRRPILLVRRYRRPVDSASCARRSPLPRGAPAAGSR